MCGCFCSSSQLFPSFSALALASAPSHFFYPLTLNASDSTSRAILNFLIATARIFTRACWFDLKVYHAFELVVRHAARQFAQCSSPL